MRSRRRPLGSPASSQVAKLRNWLETGYRDMYPRFINDGHVGMAERCLRRGLLAGAAAQTTRSHDDFRESAPLSAFLISSSHWQSMLNVAVRSLHKHEHADPFWSTFETNLHTDCPSLAASVPMSFATDVISFALLRDMIESCLVDSRVLHDAAEAGGSIDAVNGRGWGSVHHAAMLGSATLLVKLLKLGADPALRTDQGHTALHIAVLCSFAPAVDVLLQHDPDLASIRDSNGRSPADLACLHDSGVRQLHQGGRQSQSWMTDAYKLLLVAGSEPCSGAIEVDERAWKVAAQGSDAGVDSDHGGWAEISASMLDGRGLDGALPAGLSLQTCEIAMRPHDLSSDEFLDDFVNLRRPVLITHADITNGNRTDMLRTAWGVPAFSKLFGAKPLGAVNVPYASLFAGGVTRPTTVPEFIESMSGEQVADEKPLYLFQSIDDLAELEQRKLHHYLPAVMAGQRFRSSGALKTAQFYLGGPGSGSPIHWHNNALNYNVYGTKLWTLFPPPSAIYSRLHTQVDSNKYARLVAGDGVLHCIQRTGDVMFVPEGWGHGVLNLEVSVGYARGFTAAHQAFQTRPHVFKANDQVRSLL